MNKCIAPEVPVENKVIPERYYGVITPQLIQEIAKLKQQALYWEGMFHKQEVEIRLLKEKIARLEASSSEDDE